MPQNLIPQDYKKFLEQLKQKVLTTRLQAARSVNKELIELYHHIGSEILQRQKQKGWGAKVIDRLSHDLCEAFPDMKGFSITNLRYMKIFAENYSESEIRQQLANELPWFHIVVLLRRIKNKEERNFYIKKAVEDKLLSVCGSTYCDNA